MKENNIYLHMHVSRTNITAPLGKKEIVTTCVLDAPRERVWRAYTDPKLIPEWWGPKVMKTHIEKMDVKPGGIWRFVQYGPDGKEYTFHGVYHEVAWPRRLITTFEFEGMPGHVSLDTLMLEEQLGGKTMLVDQSVFQSVEDRDGMLDTGMEEGMTESMDRLTELLPKIKTEKSHIA